MKENPITEEQILILLHERLHQLLDEVERVKTAIAAFGKNGNNGHKLSETGGKPVLTDRLAPIKEYGPEMRLDDKIAYALDKLGHASKKEIVSKIMEAEPGTDIGKLESNLAARLSHLLKTQQISGQKTGRVYQYWLEKEHGPAQSIYIST